MTGDAVAVSPAPFSTVLRTETTSSHSSTEGSGYLDALLGGDLSLDGYAAMVVQHHHIYAALEEAADLMRLDPVASVFVHDGLTRRDALAADLAFLLGEDWAERIAPAPSTARYCARIREVCTGRSEDFVAHHYTRYLGDLSGGQFIGAKVAEIFDLPGDLGWSFYTFDQIGEHRAFKDRYRALLDVAPWDAGARRRLIDEVVLAYDFNGAVFADLAAGMDAWRSA